MPGDRLGKLMRGSPFSTDELGGNRVGGGEVRRTVSFFGSFKSAMTIIFRYLVSGTITCLSNRVGGVKRKLLTPPDRNLACHESSDA